MNSIRLRALEPDDLSTILRIENLTDNWECSPATGPYSYYQIKRYIEENQNDLFQDRQLRLVIESETNCIVGTVDLFNFSPRHLRAEIGIGILPEFRNKGIASAAVSLLENHSFRILGLKQLYAYVPDTNPACLALFRKAEYHHAGMLSNWIRRGCVYTDVHIFQKFNPDN